MVIQVVQKHQEAMGEGFFDKTTTMGKHLGYYTDDDNTIPFTLKSTDSISVRTTKNLTCALLISTLYL